MNINCIQYIKDIWQFQTNVEEMDIYSILDVIVLKDMKEVHALKMDSKDTKIMEINVMMYLTD